MIIRSRKLLIIILGLLLTLTIIEIIYYYSLNFNFQAIFRNLAGINEQNNKSNFPAPAFPSPAVSINGLDSVLLMNLLDSSLKINPDVLKQFVVSVTLEGEIQEIMISDKPPFTFILRGEDGGLHPMKFPEDTEKQKSQYTFTDLSENKLELTELQLGDRIKITVSMDISQSKSGQALYAWQITRL
ncbi:MAG: hypothetical protein UV73_C0002G0101 [Candidatus Gottesmanbacteria bacterium GW2011_GWA2_43_14]|uniref:Uncharacterized protein n=1 Tax=Candidatus Gottesmanbacteria bacterium GW2011_GWA2_43_14 TaxID=1618443 RepID=A0A0G1DLC0_9BACT|nr:MAG: hypothetical protein UV73_C0002G0101 [Candidatus Gottesmanbacteria bacterium GW2011_GWA2_43_14]